MSYDILITKKKPITAVALLVLGGLFVLVEGLLALVTLYYLHVYPYSIFPYVFHLSLDYMLYNGLIILTWLPAVLCGIAIISCGLMANSTNVSRVKVWSILAMFLSFLSLAVALGGLFFGFVFAFAGSIVGIKYEG